MTGSLRQAAVPDVPPIGRTDEPAASRSATHRIRVLINGIHANTGGGLTYLRNIVPALAADDGLDLHLLIRTGQRGLFPTYDERVPVHISDAPRSLLGLLLWEQIALPFLARRMGADVTFSPANYGPLAAPGRVILLSNALAVGGRETRVLKRLYWLSLSLMTGLSVLTANRVIAVSTYARRALSLGLSRLEERVVLVHHGVSRSFSPAPPPAVRDKFLLAVGDLYIQKNFHTLLRAVASLRERFPDVLLKIAGADIDPDYGCELRRIVADRGLAGHVEFLGAVDQETLQDLYRRCRLFVFPSTVETFGMPLIEAMACGAPIACSNATAMPEIAGGAAAFFDPLDEAEMARVLADLIEDDRLCDDLSRKSLERARDFSWEEAASRTAAVLKSAAGHTAVTPT